MSLQQKKNRCLFLDKNHNLTLKEQPVPEPGPEEVLVRILVNGICGSDVHFFKEGRLGNFVVDQPYIPGHEACGVIEAVGPDVTQHAEGERVVIEPGIPCGRCSFCRSGRYNLCPDVIFLSAPPINGTFCDYIVVRSDAALKMPDNLTFDAAALAEPAAVAVHAVKRARFSYGDTALIVGAGPIGLLVAQAFRAAGGGPTWCSDLQEKRLKVAEDLGFSRWVDGKTESVDVVFDTSGSPKACSELFSKARPGGCVVQVGWPAGNLVTLNIADFIDRELDYVAVNRYANAFQPAMQWLADGRIQAAPLITHAFSLDEGPEAFRVTAENPKEVIKTIVRNT